MSYYTLTTSSEAEQAAEWTYRTTLDPVLSASRSRTIAVAMYQHAKSHGYVETFMREWLSIRAEWLARQARSQRNWQQKTRNPNKARHHDSISIRERYVRTGL